ncbi:tyrosine-type recombinase/integrase [Sorangium sp. So ce1078]|uniref:tyrosine-type recombinase/integrase n=1 Tax=Sorangium sp. So ce1078 TaxID=3133329 RepID=UPI003F5DDF8A
MTGVPLLLASLLYGAGLRLLECAELRVKDLDLERRKILVRDGKGRKDRITMLPLRLVPPLRDHLTAVRAQHAADVRGARAATPCVTPSPRTCWKPATTSAPYGRRGLCEPPSRGSSLHVRLPLRNARPRRERDDVVGGGHWRSFFSRFALSDGRDVAKLAPDDTGP